MEDGKRGTLGTEVRTWPQRGEQTGGFGRISCVDTDVR